MSKSDPFAILTMGVEKCTSSVKESTVNPEWGEGFKFISSNPDFETLTVTIYDEDTGVADDLLGKVEVKVAEIKSAGRFVKSYKLEDADAGITQGELDLEFEWEAMY